MPQNSSLEIQVYDGDGEKPKRRQKPRQLMRSGEIRFRLDDFPVTFKYSSSEKVDELEARQYLRFSGARCGFSLVLPKADAIPITRESLIRVFLNKNKAYLHRAIKHAREFGQRSLGAGVWP